MILCALFATTMRNQLNIYFFFVHGLLQFGLVLHWDINSTIASLPVLTIELDIHHSLINCSDRAKILTLREICSYLPHQQPITSRRNKMLHKTHASPQPFS